MTNRIYEDMKTEREKPRELDQIFERFLPESKSNKINHITGFSDRISKNNNYNSIGISSNLLLNNVSEILKKDNLEGLIKLENNEYNERIDSFILYSIERQISERRTSLLEAIPAPVLDAKKRFSNSGLTVRVDRYFYDKLTINGKKIVFDNGECTKVDFTPGGRHKFMLSQMTDSLTRGIHGIIEMVEAVDKGDFTPAQIFVGSTNINMALIAQRFGFVIVDECRTPDGNINRNLKEFTVVGRLDDIRSRVGEFKRAGVEQKLAQRNQKLQLKRKPVPVG